MVGRAIQRPHHQHMTAMRTPRQQYRGERRHPRGKCYAGIGAFQLGNRVFGARHGGVVQARIDRVGGIVLAANQRIKTGPRHIEIGDRVGGG